MLTVATLLDTLLVAAVMLVAMVLLPAGLAALALIFLPQPPLKRLGLMIGDFPVVSSRSKAQHTGYLFHVDV